MYKWRINDITNHDGETRIDNKYPQRIGSIVNIATPEKNDFTFLMEYIEDNEGNEKNGFLFTSKVKKVSNEKEKMVVKTENSIYYLQKLDEK